MFHRESCSVRDCKDASGAAAIEFAMITPVFLLLIIGIICFSFLLATYSALQQISAEAARAALAGLSSTEQSQLATTYINNVMPNYSFMDPTKITISTTSTSNTFSVNLSYDASTSFFSTFSGFFSSGPVLITRSSTIQVGGF